MFAVRHRISVLSERLALAAGRYTAEQVDWSNRERLVFVCTGNICRSPYAEAYARNNGLSAVSAGTDARPGCQADPGAVAEAARRGIDLLPHKTTRWDDLQLRTNDLMIALQLRHARAVEPRAVAANVPVLLMSGLLAPDIEIIRDPYGRDSQAFATAFDQIERGIAAILQLSATRLVDGRSQGQQAATHP